MLKRLKDQLSCPSLTHKLLLNQIYSYSESYLSTYVHTSLQYNVFFVNIALYLKLEKQVKQKLRAF